MEICEIAGKKVFFLKETTSTMDVARSLCNNEDEFVVVAKKQSKGRGRHGRQWVSDEGGLYLSVVWKNIDKNFMNHLFIIVAMAVVETLRSFGISAKIKLPNDVYVKGKKIAGILIENSGMCVIIGIGINVNNKIDDKMDEAISCRSILDYTLDIDKFLCILLSCLFKARESFEKNSEKILNNIRGLLI